MTQTPSTAESVMFTDMSAAEIAVYAFDQWKTLGDQVHELHTIYDAELREIRELGQSGLQEASLTGEFVQDRDRALRQMTVWLYTAQVACEVAKLPMTPPGRSDAQTLAEMVRLAMTNGEGPERIAPGSAAHRWRVMSPDQRAATKKFLSGFLGLFE